MHSKQAGAFARFNRRDRLYRHAGRQRATRYFTDGFFCSEMFWTKDFSEISNDYFGADA
jgi:hypothetical protein